jgi:5-deoxy-D-glucuronate isomerase
MLIEDIAIALIHPRVLRSSELMLIICGIENGIVVLLPNSYYPVAACQDYDLYDLILMTGSKRIGKLHNQKENKWLLEA